MIETHTDKRGSLTVIEKLPFKIKRVYYIYDVPHDQMRGAHAHKKTERFMFALNGRFKLTLDGVETILYDPAEGVHIPSMSWVELSQFSKNAICLVVASTEHKDSDCIREYGEFLKLKTKSNGK